MVKANVPTAAIVGVVAGEQVQLRIDGHVIDVAQPPSEDFQSGAVRANPGDATAEELAGGAVLADRLVEAVIAHGDIQITVDAELDTVGRVVGAAKLEIAA